LQRTKKNLEFWDYLFKKNITKEEIPEEIKGIFEESMQIYDEKLQETKFTKVEDTLGRAKLVQAISKRESDLYSQAFQLYLDASSFGSLEARSILYKIYMNKELANIYGVEPDDEKN